MDGKEDAEQHYDRESSPMPDSQHLSEEAVRAATEAFKNAYSSGLNSPKIVPQHRRSRSETVAMGHKRTNSLQRLKSHVQRAWKWGNNSREEIHSLPFNPEVLANQKRQWYQLHSKSLDHVKYKEPTSPFEHFVIVGLHPDSNLEAVEDAYAKRKMWEKEVAKSEFKDFKRMQQPEPSVPTLEPQVLYKYPPGKKLGTRMKDLASFCFPEGVKARLLERTPSLSELNELVYGQEHLSRDDFSFIFSLKVADNATLYGVCLHVPEIVQRPPGIFGISVPLSHPSGGCSRFLISAPRCYCVLTRVPFFELHTEILNSIIAQERLNRITQFVSDVTLNSHVPSESKLDDQMNVNGSHERESFSDWMSSAIPVDSAAALTAAAAGIISDDDIPHFSPKILEPQSPESVTASDASDLSEVTSRRNLQYHDEYAFESPDIHSDASERVSVGYENGYVSPEVGMSSSSSRSRALDRLGSSDSLFSPARSMVTEDEDDEPFANHERDYGDELIMEWARANKNDLLQIICGYHSLPIPPRGGKLVFQPLEHLRIIHYRRPSIEDLGYDENCPYNFESVKVNATMDAAEDAFALSTWTTTTICRVLSLECVLALVTGVLLEKQVVVICPNLGVLSATVLSLVPMIRPFQWQSLFLPILPRRMLDFLDAPVPYIVGIQNKPPDLKMKTSNLVHVNVLKDQVKMCRLPKLPRYKELAAELGPIHAKLSQASSNAKKYPVYRCNEVQAEAAAKFLSVMRCYLESLCSNLRSHTITSVQSNNDRVSLLLKDSFIGSFPSRDQPFVKLLVDTQLFSVLSDSRLSRFENGYL